MGKEDYALMAEYHRGYEDGRAARAANEWALHQKRIQAMNRVDDYITKGYKLDDCPFWLPTLPGVIHALLDTDTYCLDDLVNGLKELLGADEDVREPLVEYDALGNERHKAICELRKLADAIDDGQWVGMDDLADALGLGGWISNPVRKLLQLFAGDEYDSCADVHSERHDDALSETIRNSNVYCAQPSATHKPWVAKEQREKISPPKCMDGKVIHLGDFVVADDRNGHEVMGDVWEIKRCLLLNSWSINISTPAGFAIQSECRWFLETEVMRHATREEKAPIVSRLVQDGIVSDEWAEKQLKDESSQYAEVLYDEIGFAQNPAAQVVYDDLLDLLRDAARDYRSLQQADELRTHVLDAAIEENKSLRRKLREPDTPESIVRDLTLGNISESDAIRRIEKLGESE